ncbi:hypothetical protein SDC9_74354 [bioreactor metagenome]|uniref:Uncharacterized protein n=1 Tax=bioreactor metagenome TaxID=1076179 RepID=A0A644YHA8_9ZZZZ
MDCHDGSALATGAPPRTGAPSETAHVDLPGRGGAEQVRDRDQGVTARLEVGDDGGNRVHRGRVQIVHQDDPSRLCARGRIVDDRRGDLDGPVGGLDIPEDDRHALLSGGRGHGGVVRPVGRPHQFRSYADDGLDRIRRLRQLGGDLGGSEGGEVRVVPAVVHDLVAVGEGPLCGRREVDDVLPDDEEGRLHVVRIQQVDEPAGVLAGTVIEGEDHALQSGAVDDADVVAPLDGAVLEALPAQGPAAAAGPALFVGGRVAVAPGLPAVPAPLTADGADDPMRVGLG